MRSKVRSPLSIQLKAIETKVLKFIELGAIVGILIDPDEETVAIYRSTGEPIILANGDILRVAELFPGWELWPPIFTEEETQS